MRNGSARAAARPVTRLAARPVTLAAARPVTLLAASLLSIALAGCGQSAGPAAPGSPAATTGASHSAATVSPGPAGAAPAGPSAPPGFEPLSFTAISTTHWWVLGTVPCGDRDCPGLVTTTDGGASFASLPAPGGRFGPGLNRPPAAANIRFAGPSDGWAFGPALYATHDGGRHWTAIPMPGQVIELEPGLGAVYAVVSPPAPACARTGSCSTSPPAPGLWRAAPSSDRWAPDPAAGGVSGGLAVHGRSVWVLDTMRTSDGPAAGTGLLHSADGGGHFALEPGTIPGIGCTYSPVSDAVLWAYCSGGHFMFAYRSADAGTHFAGAAPGQGSRTTPDGYPNGSGLVAASAVTAVAASNLAGGPLIRSTDAGATWSAVQPPPDSRGSWSLIGFTTPEVGYAFWVRAAAAYAARSARLWSTADGGATWSPVAALP